MQRIILIFSFLLYLPTLAQESEITGMVSGMDGANLAGASIQIIAKDRAVIANYNGEFKISAAIGDELSISYLGYKTTLVEITDLNASLIILLETAIAEFGITYSELIDDKKHNLYYSTSFNNQSVLGYRFSFSNHYTGQIGTTISGFESFLASHIDLGIEALSFTNQFEAVNAYVQFEAPIHALDFGTENFRVDIEPYVNLGFSYFWDIKLVKPKFDFGSTLFKIGHVWGVSMEFFVNYSMMPSTKDALFFGLSLGKTGTISRIYY